MLARAHTRSASVFSFGGGRRPAPARGAFRTAAVAALLLIHALVAGRLLAEPLDVVWQAGGNGGGVKGFLSPDGKTLATNSADNTVKFWDVATKALVRTYAADPNIFAVAFSPDWKTFAVGTDSGETSVIEAATLKVRTSWREVDAKKVGIPVYCLAFAPDGRSLFGGYSGGLLKRYPLVGTEKAVEYTGVDKSINVLAVSPDGKTLAAGSAEGPINLWDAAKGGKPVSSLDAGEEPGEVFSVAFAGDSKSLAAGFALDAAAAAAKTTDSYARIWDAADPTKTKLLWTLKGHTDVVRTVAFLPDGKTLATGAGNFPDTDPVTGMIIPSQDDRVILWETATGKQAAELKHAGGVMSVAVSADGKALFSGGIAGTVKVFDVATQKEAGAFGAQTGAVTAVAISPDSKVLAAASADNRTIRLWKVEDAGPGGTEVRAWTGRTETHGLAFTPDGKGLVSGARSEVKVDPKTMAEYFAGSVRLWDPATGAIVWETLDESDQTVNAVAFSPDGKAIAAGGRDDVTRLRDAATGKELLALKGTTPALAVAFSSDGKTVFVGYEDSSIRMWEVATGKERALLGDHTKAVNALALSPDGTLLASGSDDTTIILWDSIKGAAVRTLKPGAAVRTLSFAPDGKTLAAGHDDRKVTVWCVKTGKLLKAYDDHTGQGVSSLVYSANSKYLGLGRVDETVVLARNPYFTKAFDCGCRPDCNQDGQLDVNDYICFREQFTARDAFADYDGDGRWNIRDYIAYQQEFDAGCQ